MWALSSVRVLYVCQWLVGWCTVDSAHLHATGAIRVVLLVEALAVLLALLLFARLRRLLACGVQRALCLLPRIGAVLLGATRRLYEYDRRVKSRSSG